MPTLKQLILDSTAELAPFSESPRLDVELILQTVLNKDRVFLFTEPDYAISQQQLGNINKLLARRLTGEPMAYILGYQEFWSLPFKVSPATLIPRADTEILVEQSLKLIQNLTSPIIFELGTGSGAIAIALAKERPDSQIIASDLSTEALKIAEQNVKNLAVKNVQLIQSNWLNAYPKTLQADLIVSNPPYIANDCPHLESNVKKYEPSSALISDENGYKELLTIINQSQYYLRPQGKLVLEHGIGQDLYLSEKLNQQGFISIQSVKDLAGIKRCIHAVFG